MRWHVIEAFESVASLLDDAFQHLQFVSSSYGTRALSTVDFELHEPAKEFARRLPGRLDAALLRLGDGPPISDMFDRIATAFQNVTTASGLFEALLMRHSDVQMAKPPQGKREWFERACDDRVMVRRQYRQAEHPSAVPYWRRPYAIVGSRRGTVDIQSLPRNRSRDGPSWYHTPDRARSMQPLFGVGGGCIENGGLCLNWKRKRLTTLRSQMTEREITGRHRSLELSAISRPLGLLRREWLDGDVEFAQAVCQRAR